MWEKTPAADMLEDVSRWMVIMLSGRGKNQSFYEVSDGRSSVPDPEDLS